MSAWLMPVAPTTMGIPSVRRMMAVWDVALPVMVITPSTVEGSQAVASLGNNSSVKRMLGPGKLIQVCDPTPLICRRTRRAISRTSTARSRKYGSSIASYWAASSSVTVIQARAAESRSRSRSDRSLVIRTVSTRISACASRMVALPGTPPESRPAVRRISSLTNFIAAVSFASSSAGVPDGSSITARSVA